MTCFTSVIYCSFSPLLIYTYIEEKKVVESGMSHKKPDGRSALSQGQIDILELLYTYRFGSRQLLADSLSVTPDSLFRKLEVLIKHQLIKKRHEPRLKLLAVPAAYYLTPKGCLLYTSVINIPSESKLSNAGSFLRTSKLKPIKPYTI